MLIRFFLFARNFVWRHENFINPLINLCPLPLHFYLTLVYASSLSNAIYPQGEILTETSRLGTIPRLCSTMPQEPRQPPRSAIKAKVYLSGKKISSLLDETQRSNGIGLWIITPITEIATLVTWDSSKRFWLRRMFAHRALEWKVIFISTLFRTTRLSWFEFRAYVRVWVRVHTLFITGFILRRREFYI